MQKIFQKTLQDMLYYEDTPVLIYKINYPCFTTTCCSSAAKSINDFYDHEAMNHENYCRTALYSMAVENAKAFEDQHFNNYEYQIDFTVTYNEGCITSLYTDTYSYTGGAHGNTIRTSNTWNFQTNTLLQLGDVYPLTPYALLYLQKCIEQQITEKSNENPGIFFDDYRFLLKDYFNTNNFYLQPCNGIIYYQHYDIAPYATGIPEFSFPIKI